jgi:lysophospholipase L1-like esterase
MTPAARPVARPGRLPAKTAWMIVTLAALASLQNLLPVLGKCSFFQFSAVSEMARLTWPNPEKIGSTAAPTKAAEAAAPLPAPGGRGHPAPPAAPGQALYDPGHSLDSFYAALLQLEQRKPGGVIRILHYGESPTSADLITADARRLLQARFGDAGHGFVLIAKPWAWYSHDGVVLRSSGWKIETAVETKLKDGFYGIGGVSFRGSALSRCEIRISDRSHTHVEVSYLEQPGGGRFSVASSGQTLGEVITRSEIVQPDFARFELPPQAGDVLITGLDGPIRLFGASLEKTAAGVVYHSLGLNGGNSDVLGRRFDLAHWREQLRHYRPDLIIINYGANETGHGVFPEKWYEGVWKRALEKARQAAEGAPILVMSPMDVGTRDESGEIGTLGSLEKLMEIQRRIAVEESLPVYNTFLAMGGSGTMGRWYMSTPRLVSADYIHPTPAGAKIVAKEFIGALLEGYEQYKRRQLPALPVAGKSR